MLIPISRRDFFKLAGAAAIGTLIADRAAPSKAQADSLDPTLNYAGRHIPVLFDVDVCVCGGGPSGVAAAFNAAQNGVKSLIIEKSIALGGLAVLGDVIPCMETKAPDSDTPYVKIVKQKLIAHGINHDDGVTGQVWTNPETLALIYDELCSEAGVEILYNATLVDALVEGDRITTVIVQTIAGLAAVKAKIFIDSTGDAYLARAAGVPSERGYEKTGNNQPMSFRFEMGGINLKKLYKYVVGTLKEDWCKSELPHFEIAEAMHRKQRYKLEEFMARGVESGELTQEEAEYMQAYTIIGKDGTMSMNCPEIPIKFRSTDPIEYSRAVTYGRLMIRNISDYLIKHLPGFEQAYIAREAVMLGARESWRIRGKYYLVEDDYHNQSRFEDAVARTAWFIDAHGEKISEPLPKGGFYEIPYRSMVSERIENLIVTGRCISASFILQASMRIQLTCMSIGEAAGIASAYALKNKIAANDVQWARVPNRSYVSAR